MIQDYFMLHELLNHFCFFFRYLSMYTVKFLNKMFYVMQQTLFICENVFTSYLLPIFKQCIQIPKAIYTVM